MCSASTIEVLLFQHFDIYLLLRRDNFFCEKAPNMLLSVVGSRALFTNPQDHIYQIALGVDGRQHSQIRSQLEKYIDSLETITAVACISLLTTHPFA